MWGQDHGPKRVQKTKAAGLEDQWVPFIGIDRSSAIDGHRGHGLVDCKPEIDLVLNAGGILDHRLPSSVNTLPAENIHVIRIIQD